MDMTPAIHMHGEQQNIVIANEYSAQQDLADMATAKELAEALNTAYPGHLWAVNARHDQGIATIHNLMLSGQWGFTLLLDDTYSASELRKRAVMAGGEILERYKVTRGKANDEQLAQMATDKFGRVIGDTSK